MSLTIRGTEERVKESVQDFYHFSFQFLLTVLNHHIIGYSSNFFSTQMLWIDLPIPCCLCDELLLILSIDWRRMVIAMIINGNNRMANKASLVSVENREIVRRRQESGSHSIQSHPRFTGHHPGRIRATLRWLFCNMKRWAWTEDLLFVAETFSSRRANFTCAFVIFFSVRRLNRNYLRVPSI